MTPATEALAQTDILNSNIPGEKSRREQQTIDQSTDWFKAIPFLMMHVGSIVGLFIMPITLQGVLLTIGTYYFLMTGLTISYHRYFSHRTFKTSRAFQFIMALWGTLTVQKGVLWWAGNHRHHHRYSDQPEDVHSPEQRGFFWSHVGWVMVREYEKTMFQYVRDLEKFPELRWLNKHYLLPVVAYAALTFLIGGWFGFYWGFVLAITVLWHGTFTINSLTHIWGKRRFKTTDTSRNNFLTAMITMGEGWHNNHHYYMNSARQGFYWWQIDMSYYVIKAFEKVGLVWDIKEPPKEVLDLGRRKESVA